MRSFDSKDTRIKIQRSMSAHEREKHVERLPRGLNNWNLAQEKGTGLLKIAQMIIQKKDLCDIYIVCFKGNGKKGSHPPTPPHEETERERERERKRESSPFLYFSHLFHLSPLFFSHVFKLGHFLFQLRDLGCRGRASTHSA